MKRSELFTRGFASKLLKEADARLYGDHGQPRKSESATGKLAATLGVTSPKAAQNKHAEKKKPKVMRVDPAQLKFRL